jgi:hypothetical protein
LPTTCSDFCPAAVINGVLNLPLATRFFANAPHLALGGAAILIGYVLAPRTRSVAHA